IIPLAKRVPVPETRGPKQRWRRVGSLAHRLQKVAISLRSLELVLQEFHGLDRVELGEELPEDPHTVEHALPEEQLLLARARAADVDRREHALVHQAAVEVDLHVAGALELLEDHLVHAAAGVDQRRADDREAPTLLDVARRAEELLRAAERVRVD